MDTDGLLERACFCSLVHAVAQNPLKIKSPLSSPLKMPFCLLVSCPTVVSTQQEKLPPTLANCQTKGQQVLCGEEKLCGNLWIFGSMICSKVSFYLNRKIIGFNSPFECEYICRDLSSAVWSAEKFNGSQKSKCIWIVDSLCLHIQRLTTRFSRQALIQDSLRT